MTVQHVHLQGTVKNYDRYAQTPDPQEACSAHIVFNFTQHLDATNLYAHAYCPSNVITYYSHLRTATHHPAKEGAGNN